MDVAKEKESNELTRWFDTIKELNKKICAGALFLGIAVSLIFLLLGNLAISKGFLLGTCFSIINFILLSSSMPFSWGNGRRYATGVYFVSIIVRYIILAIPVIIALKSNRFNLASTIAGIFSIQIVIFSYYIIRPIAEKRMFVSGE